MSVLKLFSKKLIILFPFWIFLIFFKFAGGLHYTMMAPLGATIFPIWIVGILVGAAAFVQLLFDVPAGYLSDKVGYKKMLIVTTVFFIMAACCLLFGLSKTIFLLSLGVSILGWQFFSPAINAYIIGHSTDEDVGKLISIKDVSASIGIVLSSALVVFAVSWNAHMLGMILVCIFIVALTAIVLTPHDALQKPEHIEKRSKKLHMKFFKEAWAAAHSLKPASYLLMMSSFTGATFYAIIWFVVPLLIVNQLHTGALGIGLGIFDFSVVILGFFLGRLVDSFDKKLLVLFGISIFAIAGMLLGSNFGFLFLLFGFIATSGDELTGLSLWAWLYSIDTEHKHYGLITGMINLFDDLGWTVGPILAGILYTTVGPSLTITIGGALILLNLGIYIAMVYHPLPALFTKIPSHHEKRVRHKH